MLNFKNTIYLCRESIKPNYRFGYVLPFRSHLRGQRYLAIVRIGGPVLLRRKGSQASMDRIRDLYGEYY